MVAQGTEKVVGEAIKASGIPHEEIFRYGQASVSWKFPKRTCLLCANIVSKKLFIEKMESPKPCCGALPEESWGFRNRIY